MFSISQRPSSCSGDEGMFEWSNHGFELDGGTKPAVGVVGGPELIANLLNSLDPGDIARVKGAGETPSVRDLTADCITSPLYRRIFEAGFWAHFQGQLPGFTDTATPGIRFYPDGAGSQAHLRDSWSRGGTSGDHGSSLSRASVLHLGEGVSPLGPMHDGKRCNLDVKQCSDAEGHMVHQPLDLKVMAQCRGLRSSRGAAFVDPVASDPAWLADFVSRNEALAL